MKRDMDLVREILIEISNGCFELIDGDDKEESIKRNHLIAHHLKIMNQAGLLEVTLELDYTNNYFITKEPEITWEGHDFLDSVLNDNIWQKIKKKIKVEGGAIPFSVLKSLAIKYSEHLFL